MTSTLTDEGSSSGGRFLLFDHFRGCGCRMMSWHRHQLGDHGLSVVGLKDPETRKIREEACQSHKQIWHGILAWASLLP